MLDLLLGFSTLMEPIFERRRLLPTTVDVLVEADDSGPPDAEGRRLTLGLRGPRTVLESSSDDVET